MAETAQARELHCRVLHETITTIDAAWRHPLTNPYWRLYRDDGDGGWIDHQGGSLHLDAGRLYLVPAWGRFRSRCVRPTRHFYVHFTTLGLDGDWSDGVFERPLAVPRDAARDQLAARLSQGQPSAARRLRVQALVADSLAATIETLPAPAQNRLTQRLAGPEQMGPALRYVDDHLAERIPMAVLARQCRLSVHHFSRVFHARLGRTPTRYVQERRVAMAAERLVSGDEPIERVAGDAGFANRYHFTRVFTRCMGVPPATYRRTGRV